MLSLVFGAKAQVVMGVVMLLATAAQTYYWVIVSKPSTDAVFYVSMEALLFASYGVIATGLGYRAAERIEAHVEQVTVEGDVDVN